MLIAGNTCSPPRISTTRQDNRFKAGHPAGFIEAMANLYYDFHSSLLSWRNERRNNSQEVFGVELALEGLKWFEAMQRSIESQKWEDLD